MATPTLEDAALLNQMFQQSLSPINTMAAGEAAMAQSGMQLANQQAILSQQGQQQQELYRQLGTQETERQRQQGLFNAAQSAGVEYYDNNGVPRPSADVQRDVFKSFRTSASSGLGRLDEMIDARRKDTQKIAERMHDLATNKENPEATAKAAKDLLTNVAIVKQLRPEEMRKLSSGKASDADISSIYDRLSGGFWGGPAKAAQFLLAFNDSKNKFVGDQDKVDLAVQFNQMQDAQKEIGDIVRRRDEFVLQNSRWLPDAKLRPDHPETWTEKNPAKQVDDFIQQKAGGELQGPTVPTGFKYDQGQPTQQFSGLLPVAGLGLKALGSTVAENVSPILQNMKTALMGGQWAGPPAQDPSLPMNPGGDMALPMAYSYPASPEPRSNFFNNLIDRFNPFPGPKTAPAPPVTAQQANQVGNAVAGTPLPAPSAAVAPGGPPTSDEINQIQMLAQRPPFNMTPQQVAEAAQKVAAGDPLSLQHFNEMLRAVRTANLGISVPATQ